MVCRLILSIVALAVANRSLPAAFERAIAIRSPELPLNLVPNYDLKIEDFDTWAETW